MMIKISFIAYELFKWKLNEMIVERKSLDFMNISEQCSKLKLPETDLEKRAEACLI